MRERWIAARDSRFRKLGGIGAGRYNGGEEAAAVNIYRGKSSVWEFITASLFNGWVDWFLHGSMMGHYFMGVKFDN